MAAYSLVSHVDDVLRTLPAHFAAGTPVLAGVDLDVVKLSLVNVERTYTALDSNMCSYVYQ